MMDINLRAPFRLMRAVAPHLKERKGAIVNVSSVNGLRAFAGVLAVAAGYLLRGMLPWDPTLRSTTPFDRGLLYVLTTIGSTLVALAVIGPLARRYATTAPVRWLSTAGRTTLTLYVLHVLVFDLLVDHLEWVRPGGLGTSLAFAAAFWVAAVVAANVWSRFRPLGPLEWWYRRFSRA